MGQVNESADRELRESLLFARLLRCRIEQGTVPKSNGTQQPENPRENCHRKLAY